MTGEFAFLDAMTALCNRVSTPAAYERETVHGDEPIDAVLGASRVLVAVTARSLAGLDEDVTLAQYRC